MNRYGYENMCMVASHEGTCYLFDVNSGKIKWHVATGKGPLHLFTNGKEEVVDYVDLKPQSDSDIKWMENNMNFYRFKPGTNPELIPLETDDQIQKYLDFHFREPRTTVGHTRNELHFNYDTGVPVSSSLDAFKIERVTYYIHTSPPTWSLKIVRIRAWFPSYGAKCEVYHSRDSQKYIQFCNKFNLHPLPEDSYLNKLMNARKDRDDLLAINQRIKIDSIFTQGKHGTTIHKGTYDSQKAIVKKAKRTDDYERTLSMIHLIGYHNNIVDFYRWERHEEFDYYAFEECGETLHDYVEGHRYTEMSKDALKIMRGLADGVKHLHGKGIAHMNLNPHNILVNSDHTIKICGFGNSKKLTEVTGAQRPDLHNLAHIILYIMSNGQHQVEDVDVIAGTFNYRILDSAYISSLGLTGTNKEAFDLLKKLGIISGSHPNQISSSKELAFEPHFLSCDERLEYFKDLSNHLKEGDPSNQLIKDLESIRQMVLGSTPGGWFSVLGGTAKGGLLDAVGYKVLKPGMYEDTSIVSLIRFHRNAVNHLERNKTHKDQALRTVLSKQLGIDKSQLEHNLRNKFPSLLMEVYNMVRKHKGSIDIIKKYYCN